MRKKIFAIAAMLIAAGMTPAHAAFTMLIDDGAGHTRTVNDNGLNDIDSNTGEMTFIGGVGGVWTFAIDVALSKPVVGDPTHPVIDLSIQSAYSSAPGTLKITVTDTGFGPLGSTGVATLSMGGVNSKGGSVTAFGKINGSTVVSLGPLSGNAWSGSASASVSGIPSTFSLCEQVIIVHTGSGNTGGDIFLNVVPEPSTWMAGACLLLPFAASTVRIFRKRRTA